MCVSVLAIQGLRKAYFKKAFDDRWSMLLKHYSSTTFSNLLQIIINIDYQLSLVYHPIRDDNVHLFFQTYH